MSRKYLLSASALAFAAAGLVFAAPQVFSQNFVGVPAPSQFSGPAQPSTANGEWPAYAGDIKGTLGCMLMGPAGFFEMSEGVIRAMRHVHMSPVDADFYGVKAGDSMKLKIGGECGIVLDQMLCRVDPSFKLEVHIDTDEGNACNLQPETPCQLVK